MPQTDLRSFIDALDAAGDLVRVHALVSLRYEVAALCRVALEHGGPEGNRALVITKTDGPPLPIVANLVATRDRIARVLQCGREDLVATWRRALRAPRPPVVVSAAPCHQVIRRGPEVDLALLPVPTWSEKDGGPYITAACFVSRDPESGVGNVGIYRAQVHDATRLGILAAPYRHIALHWRAAHTAGRPFPVALCIGVAPAVYLAAATPAPPGADEMAIAGGLAGAPIEVTPCRTCDLLVPASSEIVLEGEIHPGDMEEEGPFGEFTGYYGGERIPRPVIQIRAITHRRDPLYHAAYVGRPPHEQGIMALVSAEAEIAEAMPLPGLVRVHMSPGGLTMVAVAQVENLYDGYARQVGTAILNTTPGRLIKTLILVDADVDARDRDAVEWSLATRFQPARDLVLLPGFPGLTLDPSLDPEEKRLQTNLTSKVILDATRPVRRPFPEEARPPLAVLERMRALWDAGALG